MRRTLVVMLPLTAVLLASGCTKSPMPSEPTAPAVETPEPEPEPEPEPPTEPTTGAAKGVSMDATNDFACALGASGSVRCWGANHKGQLGVGGAQTRTVPVRVPGIDDALEVQVGHQHGCARLADGHGRCWFEDRKGHPWNDDDVLRQIAIDGWVSCGLTDAGVARCVRFRDATDPIEGVAKIATSNGTACLLHEDGTVVCLDDDLKPHPVVKLRNVVSLTRGRRYNQFVARDAKGAGWVFDPKTRDPKPEKLPDGADPAGPWWQGVKGLPDDTIEYMPGSLACRRDAEGQLWCRGFNGTPGLARGNPGFSATPARQRVPAQVTEFSLGMDYRCWRDAAGAAQCAGEMPGDGPEGRLLADAVQVDAGDFVACALGKDGRVTCEGDSALGHADEPGPVRIAGVKNVKKIAVGSEHACALQKGGRVYCWGDNSAQQIVMGEDARETYSTPRELDKRIRAVDVAVTDVFTCVLDKGRDVHCFGELLFDDMAPIFAEAPKIDRLVLGGMEAICAIGTNGGVYCQEDVSFGDAGSDDWLVEVTEDIALYEVNVGAPVKDLAIGGTFACAVQRDGKVSCWGSNESGQLGRGETGGPAGPGLVAGIDDAVAVSANWLTACAVRKDGSVWCWGMGVEGVGPVRTDQWGKVDLGGTDG